MKLTIRRKMKNVAAGTLAGVMLAGSLGTMDVHAAGNDELLQQASEAYDNGYYMKAGSYLQKLWEQSEGSEENLKSFATHWMVCMYNKELYWYVEQIYELARQHDAMSMDIEFYYARSLKECGRYEDAVNAFYRAMEYCEGENAEANVGLIKLNIADCMNMTGKEADVVLPECMEGYEMTGNEGYYLHIMKELYVDNENMPVDEFVSTYLQGKTNEEIGIFLNDNELYKEAAVYYEKAESEDGADVRFQLAGTYYCAGDTLKAVEILEQLVEEEPENTGYMNYLGSIYCDALGRYEEAQALFERVVELNPNANAVRGNMAVAARKSGDFEGSFMIYQELLMEYPDYEGMINNAMNSIVGVTSEQAQSMYSNYVDWPDNSQLQAITISNALSASRMTLESMEDFLAYFESCDPNSENYYLCNSRAYLLRELGRYEEALDLYDRCRELSDIHSYDIQANTARCYLAMEKYDDAVMLYQNSYEGTQKYWNTSFYFDTYMTAGKTSQAKEELDFYAKDVVKESEVADLYMIWAAYVEDYDQLLKYADLYLEKDPASVKAKAYKVAALQELGRRDEADRLLEEIDSIQYDCSSTDKMIAESVLGRLENAKAIYQILLEQYPTTARTESNDYELKNLFADVEFCEMAGREPIVNEDITEKSSEEEAVQEDVSMEENEAASNNVESGELESQGIPVAAGVGILAALGAAVAVLLIFKKHNK